MRGVTVKKRVTESSFPKRSVHDLMQASIVVINKHKGPFSYEITDSVKKILHARKTGHAGTLDPNATGTLPIGVNRGCHVLQAISHASKEYEGVMHLHSSVSLSEIISTSKKFTGKIIQLPPVRSAVKREERERVVYSIDVEDKRDRDVYFTISCEAGTYVRKIASEWGLAMGTNAHLKDLVRTKAGPYTLDDAVTLEEFSKNPFIYLKPIETAVAHLGHVWVDDSTVKSISHGSQPFLPGIYKFESGIESGDLIALMNSRQELIAIAFSLMNSDEMNGKKGQFARLERVFL